MYRCTGCPLTSFGARKYDTFPVGSLSGTQSVQIMESGSQIEGGVPELNDMKNDEKNQTNIKKNDFFYFLLYLHVVRVMLGTCFRVSCDVRDSFSMSRHQCFFSTLRGRISTLGKISGWNSTLGNFTQGRISLDLTQEG